MGCVDTVIRCIYINCTVIYMYYGTLDALGTLKFQFTTVNYSYSGCMDGIIFSRDIDTASAYIYVSNGIVIIVLGMNSVIAARNIDGSVCYLDRLMSFKSTSLTVDI